MDLRAAFAHDAVRAICGPQLVARDRAGTGCASWRTVSSRPSPAAPIDAERCAGAPASGGFPRHLPDADRSGEPGGTPAGPGTCCSTRRFARYSSRARVKAPMRLVTNDLVRPATETAALYKERWQIELLFKWIKQNLKIKRFLGRRKNAVKIQIYVALIAYLLLRMLRQTCAASNRHAPKALIMRIKVALFNRIDLSGRATPPPADPTRKTTTATSIGAQAVNPGQLWGRPLLPARLAALLPSKRGHDEAVYR
ncbi:transposase [Sphingobium sp. MK2]|uniref:transposase n=1 Tax=Sphingobium sp. MK2 TaxID=3116540 RepID=UPI00386A0C10